MGDSSDWHHYKHEQRMRRQARMPGRVKEIVLSALNGYQVVQLSQYHFRINGVLDLYPLHRRWHDIRTNERGDYRRVHDLYKEKLRENVNGNV